MKKIPLSGLCTCTFNFFASPGYRPLKLLPYSSILANFFIVFQAFSFLSMSSFMTLLQVPHGLPLKCFPCGFQSNAFHITSLILRICPNHSHHLLPISSATEHCLVFLWTSSLATLSTHLMLSPCFCLHLFLSTEEPNYPQSPRLPTVSTTFHFFVFLLFSSSPINRYMFDLYMF